MRQVPGSSPGPPILFLRSSVAGSSHFLATMNALDVIYTIGAAVLFPLWGRKSRGGWKQRLGHITPPPPKQPGRTRILIHAVSVGEVSAAKGLVEHLIARGYEVILATTTDTGTTRAAAIFAAEHFAASPVTVLRYPLDFSASVNRFLDAVKPDLVALMELEVWPNFVAACRRRNIPIGVVNGRLSARSFKGYRRIKPAIGKSFASLAFAAVQDAEYAERFLHMGVAPDRCTITGTMKWDTVKPNSAGKVSPAAEQLARELGIDRTRPVIVAGSTADGEEALIHRALALRPTAQLICAPRKPERFDEAAAALPGCLRRSTSKGTLAPGPNPQGRYLLDTLGELGLCYQLADLVIIGRTFTPLGGSDPMEPAGLGKPLVCGPHMTNFSTVAKQLSDSGGLAMVTAEQLPATLAAILASPDKQTAMTTANLHCVEQNRGATARTAERIAKVLGGQPAAKP